MQCLYCGKQLALLRRWTGGGEFCSEAHKQSYHQEYNQLALGRLRQAQSNPADYRAPRPVSHTPSAALALSEKANHSNPQGSEHGWTTVRHTDQSHLPAPPAEVAIPAAPAAPAARQAPGKAGFLADKPRIQVPPGAEPPSLVPSPLLVAPEPYQPRLVCSIAQVQSSVPPPRAGLVRLASPPGVLSLDSRSHPEPVRITPSHQPIPVGLALSPKPVSALAMADILPMELYPAGLGKPEPELQPAYPFEFPCVFEPVAGGSANTLETSPAAAVERDESDPVVPAPERRLLDLFPLHLQPSPRNDKAPNHKFGQIPMRTFQPELPATTPLPLRPRVAAVDPVNVSLGALRAALAVKVSIPERNIPEAPALASLPQNGKAQPQTSIHAVTSEVDLPGFLKALDSAPSGSSVWGSVHRYLKNIVGGLLFATLGGGYYWHVSATQVPNVSSAGPELSGEADRSTPERQIFIYPASMRLQDYRVDFEAPLSTRGTGWVFRVADPRNYYGMRLESEQDHGVLRWKIQKFVQVEGERLVSEAVALPITGETDYCRMAMEVQGSQFRTYLQGHLIDRWTDTRFSRGGFGYYGGFPEPLPIRSVRIAALESVNSPKVDRK